MLRVERLRKDFGALTAVNGVSFELKPGDVFGFIGSNGAGKTTTIRMLATLLEPTSGVATINGVDVARNPMAARRLIGYMPDFFGLYDDLRVWEYLDFFAALYGVPTSNRPATIERLLELVHLTGKRADLVQTLSRGMQQRLCLARCLVHDPALLLLDEPASGLDPRARSELKELLAELGRAGKIVLVSSHILPELADFCNVVGIIERGDMLAFGPMKEVVGQFQAVRSIQVQALGDLSDVRAILAKGSLVGEVLDSDDGGLKFEMGGGREEQAELLKALVLAGCRITDFHAGHADLEDVFLRITTGAVN